MLYKAIHHTGVSQKNQPIQLWAVNKYHKEKFGYLSSLGWYVGYNYFLDVDGTLTYCRKEGEETMAQIGHNHDTISICLALNGDIEYPNEKQKLVLKKWLDERPMLKTTLHRELQPNRICPGKLITFEWINSLFQSFVLVKTEDDKKAKKICEMVGRFDYIKDIFYKILIALKVL